MRPEIKKIAGEILIANAYLNSVHKAFNAIKATSDESLDKEGHAALQAVVTALDALYPAFGWAIDNG